MSTPVPPVRPAPVITLSDGNLPAGWPQDVAEEEDPLARIAEEHEAAYHQLHRVVDDLHRLRSRRDAAFDALAQAHHATLFRLAVANAPLGGGVAMVRVAALAAILARLAGHSPDWCDMLMGATPLHDIGLTREQASPQALLCPAQQAALHSHPEVGAEILGGTDIPVLRMAATIALHHHECWDGSGFPAGMAGSGISPAGRIVALAEGFDRLTRPCSARKTLSDKEALALIASRRGSSYDPDLVDLFLAHGACFIQARDFVTAQGIGPGGLSWNGDWWMAFVVPESP